MIANIEIMQKVARHTIFAGEVNPGLVREMKALPAENFDLAQGTARDLVGDQPDLLEVVEDRHGLASTVVVTQLPVDRWHDNIKEATIADAILDRLVHNAHKINFKGDSMIKLRSTLTKNRDSE